MDQSVNTAEVSLTLNAAVLKKLLSQITIPITVTVDNGDVYLTTKMHTLNVKAHKTPDGAVDQLHLIIK